MTPKYWCVSLPDPDTYITNDLTNTPYKRHTSTSGFIVGNKFIDMVGIGRYMWNMARLWCLL